MRVHISAVLTAFIALSTADSVSTGNRQNQGNDRHPASLSHSGVSWSNSTHFVDPATNQTIVHFDCDVHQGKASDHFNNTIATLHTKHQRSALSSRAAGYKAKRSNPTVSPPIQNVPLYIHVIMANAYAGTITQANVSAQVAALQSVYNSYGITFQFSPGNVDFTVNDAWSVAAGNDMNTLKAALRKGTYGALNLYFHTNLTGDILGTCTLPSTVPKGAAPSVYVSDGCNLNAFTMPNGPLLGYNMGKTAVHETGHWFGLLHTFEGNSCSGNGDFVADTPFEAVSTSGCPSNPAKNSCPSVSSGDPIHNYMDYSTDVCYSRFTADQVTRIGDMWTQYRKGM